MSSSPKLQAYIEQARAALELQVQEDAENFVQLALSEPGGLENPDALEVTAQLMSYSGDFPSAKEILERAVDFDKIKLGEAIEAPSNTTDEVSRRKPDMVRRLIALGELNEGRRSLELYKNALNLLEDLSGSDNQHQVSLISCSIAELYLSDPLCMEKDAQTQCRNFIQQAVTADHCNVDAWSLKASYHISSQENEDAKAALQKALDIFEADEQKRTQALESATSAPNASGEGSAQAEEGVARKLTDSQITRMVQLSTELEMYQQAINLGEKIVAFDKTQYRVWYYMSWAGFISKDENLIEETRTYLKECHDLLTQLKKTRDFSPDDAGLLQHVKEMIEETGGPLPEVDVSAIKDEEVEEALLTEEANQMEE